MPRIKNCLCMRRGDCKHDMAGIKKNMSCLNPVEKITAQRGVDDGGVPADQKGGYLEWLCKRLALAFWVHGDGLREIDALIVQPSKVVSLLRRDLVGRGGAHESDE